MSIEHAISNNVTNGNTNGALTPNFRRGCKAATVSLTYSGSTYFQNADIEVNEWDWPLSFMPLN